MQDKKIPEFIYGTAWKKDATKELVLKALEAGFRGIDTANQPKHYSEASVGEALKSAFKAGRKREDLFVQTKFTPLDGHDSRIPYDPDAELATQVGQSFSSSLKNLGVDYVDSYLLHSPLGSPDIGEEDLEVWRALEQLHESKKARLIGVSNINALQLTHLAERARVGPMLVQNRCYADRGWDNAVRRVCRAKGIIYQGFSLLTANSPFLRHPRVAGLCSKYGKTSAQVIFKFSQQIGILPLTGTSNESHMREDLGIGDFRLDGSEIESLENVSIS